MRAALRTKHEGPRTRPVPRYASPHGGAVTQCSRQVPPSVTPEQVDSVTDLMERVWRCAEVALRDRRLSITNAPPDWFRGEWTGEQAQRDATIALAYQRYRRNSPASRARGGNTISVIPSPGLSLGKLDRFAEALVSRIVRETRPLGNWTSQDLRHYGREDLDQDAALRLFETKNGPDLGSAAEASMRGFVAIVKRNLLIDKHRREHPVQGTRGADKKGNKDDRSGGATERAQVQPSDVRAPETSKAKRRQRVEWSQNEFDGKTVLEVTSAAVPSSNILPNDELVAIGQQVLVHTTTEAELLANSTAIPPERAGLWLIGELHEWSHDDQRELAGKFNSFWSEVVRSDSPPTERTELPGILLLVKMNKDLKLGSVSTDDAVRVLNVTRANFNQLCTRMRRTMRERVSQSGLPHEEKLSRYRLILRCFSLNETEADHNDLVAPEKDLPA